jgi:hypothetical protein
LAPASNGGAAVSDYVIQRSLNGTSGWTTLADGVHTTTGYRVLGLTNGTRYYFRVLAKNSIGTGPASNVANTVPRTKPSAPRALTWTQGGSGQVRLWWLAPASTGGSPIIDYVIQRSLNGTSGWTTIPDGVHTTTNYTVTGLTNGTRYYFRVVARNAAGYSPASNTISAVSRVAPSAPRSLRAFPGVGQVWLSWLAPASNGGSPITDYVIQRSLNGTSGWTTIPDGVHTTTGYRVLGLTNGTRYYFRVLAKNSIGTGPASNVANTVPRT